MFYTFFLFIIILYFVIAIIAYINIKKHRNGHAHSHGGVPCHGHDVGREEVHGHSHGGVPCHGHGHDDGHDDGHGHSHGGHGHSHDGGHGHEDCHDQHDSHRTETRGAIDLGSGAIKLTVATVKINLKTNQTTIDKQLYLSFRPVLLGHDLKKNKDNKLSQSIQSFALNIMKEMKQECEEKIKEKIKYSGVATATLREAKNGQEFIDKINQELQLNIEIISQYKEGVLGFRTGMGVSKKREDEIIVWDSGAASFQLTCQDDDVDKDKKSDAKLKLQVYEGPLGASKVTAAMVEDIQGKSFAEIQTSNPTSLDDFHQLCQFLQTKLTSLPASLQLKIDNNNKNKKKVQVVAIGWETSMFNIARLVTNGLHQYQAKDILEAIPKLVDKTDDELSHLPQPDMVLPKLALLLTVMQTYRMKDVLYCPTNGCTPGVLISPEFWK